MGVVLGLAAYNGLILDARLPPPFFKKLAGLVRGAQPSARATHALLSQQLSPCHVRTHVSCLVCGACKLPPPRTHALLCPRPSIARPCACPPAQTPGLHDLALLQPSLARGLQALLGFDGDVEATFCR